MRPSLPLVLVALAAGCVDSYEDDPSIDTQQQALLPHLADLGCQSGSGFCGYVAPIGDGIALVNLTNDPNLYLHWGWRKGNGAWTAQPDWTPPPNSSYDFIHLWEPATGYTLAVTPCERNSFCFPQIVVSFTSPPYDWRMPDTSPVPFIAGWERLPDGSLRYLPACRADYMGGTHPGKLMPVDPGTGLTHCNFSWGGYEHQSVDYQLLWMGANVGHWQTIQSGPPPAGAVIGGNEADGSPLPLCRAWFQNGLHPGKVVGSSCSLAWGGLERWVTPYDVYLP